MPNYLRYTNYDDYLTDLAHGVEEVTAYANAEITQRTKGDIETAIAYHQGHYLHLALVQVAPGEPLEWKTLCTSTPDQPRIPSCWAVVHWAESASEIEDDPADYFGVFNEYELF